MNAEFKILFERAMDARIEYNRGLITRKEALELINPYIKAFNEKSIELAKKHEVKPKLINFATFIR